MGKTLSIHLTSLLTILPILFTVFNTSVGENLADCSKDINPSPASEVNYQIRTIVIDPGHGGKDGGCVGATHSIEKHLALDIALQLGETIKANYPGIKVIYTRDRDVFIPLHQRAEIANKNKADLFISIHCNNILNAPHIDGSETYVMGLHRADDNLKVAKRENEAILMEDNYEHHYEGYDPYSAEGHIILSFVQNVFLEQSILFAEKVEKHIHHKTGRKSRGVKQAGFLVLRNTTMPSVLIEAGYLSNTSDEAYLLTKHGQNQMANAIFQAFEEYKYEMETGDAAPQLAYQPAAARYNVKSAPKATKPVTVSPRQPVSTYEQPAAPVPTRTNSQPARPSRIIPITNNSRIISTTPPVNNTQPATNNAKFVRSSRPSVQFMVQLASADRLLDTKKDKWNSVPHSINVKKEKGLYKYLAFGFKDFKTAADGQKQLRQLGFSDAFIVAYQNGERISLADAKAITRAN